MRRPWNGAMPVLLTLPLGLERRPRLRRKRLRRLAVALVALGVALLAAGFWLPARAWQPTAATPMTQADMHPRRLAALTVGDELTLARPDGSLRAYEVAGIDVVDSRRAELALEGEENVVVLVARWPFDAAPVAGDWRYVVTARPRF